METLKMDLKFNQLIIFFTLNAFVSFANAEDLYASFGVNHTNDYSSQSKKNSPGLGDDYSIGAFGTDLVLGKSLSDAFSVELAYSVSNSDLNKTTASNGSTYNYGPSEISEMALKFENFTVRAKYKKKVAKHELYIGAGIGRERSRASYAERMNNTTDLATGYGDIIEIMVGDRIMLSQRVFVDLSIVHVKHGKVNYTSSGVLNGAYTLSTNTQRAVIAIGMNF